VPKVAEPPGPGDRDTSARLRFEERRALIEAAGDPHKDVDTITPRTERVRTEMAHLFNRSVARARR
jgi:hypothetical protein